MILSKIVVNLYTVLLEIGLWLILLAGAITGWQQQGLIGALMGIIAAAIFGAIIFGAFLVLNDIRDRVKLLESKQQ